MANSTLKDLITEYGLPLNVRKPRWFGDYYFRAEKMNSTTVSGTIFLNGREHDIKVSLRAKLCNFAILQKNLMRRNPEI